MTKIPKTWRVRKVVSSAQKVVSGPKISAHTIVFEAFDIWGNVTPKCIKNLVPTPGNRRLQGDGCKMLE